MDIFKDKLKAFENQGRLRSLNLPCGLDFSSNDYLGLRTHPRLRAAAIKALDEGMAAGAGGSRLLRGHLEEYEALEYEAAAFFGHEAALYFATGFQANMALFSTLPARGDVIIFDALIHASARDGIQASPAKHIRAAHNDLNAFEEALKRAQSMVKGQIWLAVESLYSMDGDFAPLAELYALAQKYDAVLIVDEAHATGVWGSGGKGLSADLPSSDNLITLHTCGKGLGVAGGLICAQKSVVEYMINAARPFIYSTAPTPLQVHLVREALHIIRDEPERRAQLHDLCAQAQNIMPGHQSTSQIIPIILGEDQAAVDKAMALQEAGFDIRAIRPPTVPEGTARLRISLNIGIALEDLERLADLL